MRLLIVSVALLLPLPGPAAELFVSPTGSDTNAGTRAKPFATLEHARDEARRLRQDGKPPRDGLSIWLGAVNTSAPTRSS